MGVAELPPGGTVWQPVDDRSQASDAVRLGVYAERAGVVATAYGRSERTVYVGTADGRILISRDDGASFAATDTGSASGPVERIFVDPARPDVALAALGRPNVPHVLRTFNAGQFWDALDSNLPNAPAHAVTGERAAGAIYVATDRGVFWAQADLDNAGTPNVNWINLSDRLPAETVATLALLVVQATVLLVALAGATVAARVEVVPGPRVRVLLSRLTPVAEITLAATVTAQVAVLLPSAVITVSWMPDPPPRFQSFSCTKHVVHII